MQWEDRSWKLPWMYKTGEETSSACEPGFTLLCMSGSSGALSLPPATCVARRSRAVTIERSLLAVWTRAGDRRGVAAFDFVVARAVLYLAAAVAPVIQRAIIPIA